jgi:hypothetical protein
MTNITADMERERSGSYFLASSTAAAGALCDDPHALHSPFVLHSSGDAGGGDGTAQIIAIWIYMVVATTVAAPCFN